MNDLSNSRFWKLTAVLFVLSIFFLGYAILNGGAGRNAILPGSAFAEGSLTPGSGYFAEMVGTSTQDAALFIWKYDDYGVPVKVSVAYRQKDWISNTYEIKPEEKK